MEFNIKTYWDSRPFDHKSIKLVLSKATNEMDLNIHIDAPFFNDPPNPGGPVGESYWKLWEYEVVEAFFLNDKDEYLEVILCPHGQHFVLILRGMNNILKHTLPVSFTSSISGDTWSGDVVIPIRFLPKKVSKFNAFAMHGTPPNRSFEALYPQPQGKYQEHQFHRLQYFQPVDLKDILPSIYADDYAATEWN